jgi:hypothetical protein
MNGLNYKFNYAFTLNLPCATVMAEFAHDFSPNDVA